ncbi:mitochondrial carrier domain-containing protein [Mycotypha africana]|uniref:mitochondrial carrier domain-containing protein n=1 Tax=Mycotypha africana TaxID=64632 RepID=UPI002300202D|nr:mitochondrial carrier domain-containing protein [Mycotypha africana]KAI8991394.1 mitochondrial carrier domain-containing protein [Mycotypha africana]
MENTTLNYTQQSMKQLSLNTLDQGQNYRGTTVSYVTLTNNYPLRTTFTALDTKENFIEDENNDRTLIQPSHDSTLANNQDNLLLSAIAFNVVEETEQDHHLHARHVINNMNSNSSPSEQFGKVMNIFISHQSNKNNASSITADNVTNTKISPLEEEKLGSSDTMKHLIAGGVAGAISRTVVSPMERMKILFQIQGPHMPAYTGIWSTLSRIWKEEGWKGFMKGNGTNVIRMIPYSASQFAAYEQCKKILLATKTENRTELDTPRRLIAGVVAGTVSVTCTYPLDLVRTRLSIQSASLSVSQKGNNDQSLHSHQQHMKKPSGIISTTRLIYRTEGGLRGLYRGLWPTTLGVAPYVALNFQCYEVLKDYLIPADTPSNGGLYKLFCGALAGSIAQTIIYPLDVLRRRFQVVGMSHAEYQYNGTWHALTTMAKKEGVRSLYKGLVPNYLKVAPAMGVTFYSYELCKELMHAK